MRHAEPRKKVTPKPHPRLSPGRIFYGWWLVGIASLMLTLMSLTVFQGLGTILVALERQFGWSRTALSGAFSLARVEGAILGPIEGVLVDKIGTRRMVLTGYILMGLGFILLGQVDRLWEFYGAFIIITLGSGLGGWLAIIAMVNNWFDRRRSFAMASAMSGIHLGGLLVPLLAFGIETLEFRGASLVIGLFLLAIVGPATKLIRNHPEDMNLRPDGDSSDHTDPDEKTVTSKNQEIQEDEPDFTALEALKTPAFWILTITQVSSSVAIVTLALHLVPRLTDMGMTLSGASTVVLAYTLIALPSQFVSGYFADRLPKPLMISIFLTFQGIGIMVIAFANTVPLAFLFAVLYGIGFGGRSPLNTAIRGEYFGRKAFATIMGISQFPMNIGMIGAPLFAGYMFDTTASYTIPFSVFAILTFFGAVLMLFVRKPVNTNIPSALAENLKD